MIDPITKPVRSLLEAQIRHLDLDQAESIEELFSPTPSADGKERAKFLIPAKLTDTLSVVCGRQMQLQTHGIIFDPRVNTVGLIFFCPTDDPVKVENSVGAALRGAMSLSHTLRQSNISLFVELTIAVFQTPVGDDANPSESEGDFKKCIQTVTKILRNYMLESSFLHAIGVHVWTTPQDESVGSVKEKENAKLQNRLERNRVFPWLLNSTRQWYQCEEFQNRFANDTPYHKLKSLALENFRVAGKRVWELNRNQNGNGDSIDRKSKFHLIHGHNGTGKSTISEAIELWMTGKIERLGDEQNYEKILINHGCSEASLSFQFEGNDLEPQNYQVKEDGLERISGAILEEEISEPDVLLDPGSFRFEQTFADDLVRTNQGQRARRLLKAFFPDAHEAARRLDIAQEKFEIASDSINESVRNKLTRSSSVLDPVETYRILNSKLAMEASGLFELPQSGWIRNVIQFFMPAQHEAITKSLPESELEDLRTAEDWESAWQRVQDESKKTADDLETLIPFLEELNQWKATSQTESTASRQELANQMNAWLDCCAKCDLLSKETALVGVLRSQTQKKRKTSFDFLLEFWQEQKLTKSLYDKRKEALLGAQKERIGLRNGLQSLRLAQDRDTEEKGTSKRPELTSELSELLDRYVLLTKDKEPFSKMLESLFQENTPEVIYFVSQGLSMSVGQPSGITPLITILESRLDSFNERNSRTYSEHPITSLIETLEPLKVAAEEYMEAGAETLKEFRKQFRDGSDLAMALNELTALFTPARWSYQDLSFSGEQGEETELQQDGVQVNLRLNTAELNTLALVLFFLCAPSSRNPLRMLILDDPLQNMDELTVTTIARGIRRLMQLWEEPQSDSKSKKGVLADWQVVILLHGEEDLERMRRENPAFTYYLPWQSPSTGPSEEKILDSDPPGFDGRLFGLSDFFRAQ